MNTDQTPDSRFHHQQVTIDDVSIHAVTAGSAARPAILFLHGFPENWLTFKEVMTALANDFYVVAIDLPGVGKSDKIASEDKRTIARYVKGVVDSIGLTNVTVVGHDVGGMVTYAYLKAYPNELAGAVIMNVVIPGIEPWSVVERNPKIWHFTFHTIPDLPEALVTGRQRIYFDYFYNTISAKPEAISDQARAAYAEAYASQDALKTAFGWYRAFGQDAKDNVTTKGNQVSTPVLYLRGEAEYGNIDDYLKGFREGGLVNIDGKLIPGSGHYASEEAPAEVIALLTEFMKRH